jgi:isocitrate dehydrogenase
VRENEEDLYAGIEHRQTDEVYQCLKLITRPGTERIVRYAFEYARLNNRKKVTCMTKDNIMKMTDGLFHKIFDEISADYPEFEKEHYIVDIGSARLADDPERFDLVVLPNLYGDILSDVVAEIAGSVGMAGSANIGEHISMFEAIHGSAPRMAGQNRANPSGLFLGAVQMLVHMGLSEAAERCHNAWLKTLEDGIHTGDIASDTYTKKKVGTKEFAAAIVERLGDTPKILKPVSYKRVAEVKAPALKSYPPAKKNLLGFDVFVHERDRKAQNLAARIEKVSKDSAIHLKMITNRGVTVWPEGFEETFCTDHWRCRMVGNAAGPIDPSNIWKTLKALQEAGVEVIKTENLYEFDGERGYSLGQGE